MSVERVSVQRPILGDTEGVTRGAVTLSGVTVDPDTPAGAADIQAFIDDLAPQHRYKCDDVGVNLLDSGSASALDMTPVGTLTYQQGGPDVSTDSADFGSSTSFARTTAGFSTASVGTVLCFVRNFNTGSTAICNSNTVNEDFTFAFGNNPQSTGLANRVGAAMFLSTLFNRRNWSGSTDTTGWNVDNTWHLIGWVADGVGTMRINVDGNEDTVSEQTLGTPPPSSAWFSAVSGANSRGVLANARFGSGSSNNVGQQSECIILDNVELTTQQFVDLFALVTN